VALIVQRQPTWQGAFRRSAWYEKPRPTFADALAQVRRALWRQLGFWLSEVAIEKQKSAPMLFEHFAELLAYVARKWTNSSLEKIQ
jgi:transposase